MSIQLHPLLFFLFRRTPYRRLSATSSAASASGSAVQPLYLWFNVCLWRNLSCDRVNFCFHWLTRVHQVLNPGSDDESNKDFNEEEVQSDSEIELETEIDPDVQVEVEAAIEPVAQVVVEPVAQVTDMWHRKLPRSLQRCHNYL